MKSVFAVPLCCGKFFIFFKVEGGSGTRYFSRSCCSTLLATQANISTFYLSFLSIARIRSKITLFLNYPSISLCLLISDFIPKWKYSFSSHQRVNHFSSRKLTSSHVQQNYVSELLDTITNRYYVERYIKPYKARYFRLPWIWNVHSFTSLHFVARK